MAIYLPNEVLANVFKFLGIGDLLIANLVCKQWREAAAYVLEDRATVMAVEDFNPGVEVFIDSDVQYKHWIFKNIDVYYRSTFASMWDQYAESVKSLALIDVEITERDLLSLLHNCWKIEQLCLAGFSHIFMTGTFLENSDDLNLLKKSLRNVSRLRLSCSRYLTDAIFTRISSTLGALTELCLAGCQISYQNSIYKRFYPADGSVKVSEHVFTYYSVLKLIEKNKNNLKVLSLSNTSIDSDSLTKLSEMPGLKLETLVLLGCDQLTKGGIQSLSKNQRWLRELDISLCSRVTDYAIIAIADHLPQLESLSIRRCQSVTEVGVEHLSRLKLLKKLDISHLDVRKWESIHEALGKVARPSMTWLSVASLPIQWETVFALSETVPNLKHLDLSMCTLGVIDKSIQAICKSLIKLEVLYLSGCSAISDIGLSGHGLGDRPEAEPDLGGTGLSLETLGIRDRNPYRVNLGSKSEQAIRQEGEVKQYLKRHVHQIINSSSAGLLHLSGLKELNLCMCLRVSDLTLRYAIQFTELSLLNLSHCQQVSEDGLIQVCLNCPSLESLLLGDCSNTSDRVVLVIAHRLKRIKTLDFKHCTLLTNDALDSLSNCRTLRYLDVSGCDKMNLDGINIVKSRIPRLLNLHYRGIGPSNDQEEDGLEAIQPAWAKKKAPTPPPLLAKLVRKLTR